jgi:hypothetical protein
MLTAMNLIAQVPDNRRSPEQRQKAARFEEFGCTFCHKITGQVGSNRCRSEADALALGVGGRAEAGGALAEAVSEQRAIQGTVPRLG